MVELVELSPRWVLQDMDAVVPLETKLRLCRQLHSAGFQRVEATALVRGLPQFADAPRLLEALALEPGIWRAAAAGPNEAEAAVDAGAGEVAVVALPEDLGAAVPHAVGERLAARVGSGFSPRADWPGRVEDALERTATALSRLSRTPVRTVAAVPAGFGHPGETADVWLCRLTDQAGRLIRAGADELSLADAWSLATPARLGSALDALARVLPGVRLAVQPRGLPDRALASVQRAVRSVGTVLECALPLPKGKPSGPAGTRQVLAWLSHVGPAADVAAAPLAAAELTLAVASSRWLRPVEQLSAREREED